jgi:PAS domain S-box-containing protein
MDHNVSQTEKNLLSYLTSLVENAGIPFITTDLAGQVTGCNPAAERFYGCVAEEINGQSISIIISPYNRPEHERAIWIVGQEAHSWETITDHISSDGRTLSVRLILSPIKDGDGAVIGISWLSIDLGEQVAVQNALQQERDLLEAILETANDAMIMLDTSGRPVSANLQFESFFRLQRYQMVGQPIELLLELIRSRPDLPGELVNVLATFGTDRYQTAGGDFEITSPERRVLVWYSAPVHAHDGETMGRLFVFRDATREREVDRMKTEFVSLVSHELRTPLTSIKGFADFILEGDAGSISDEVRSYLGIIEINADRLTNLISDILDLTRIEAGRIELHQDSRRLADILESVLISMRPMIEKRKQHLHAEVTEGLPPIWADFDRLAQVISNLLSNASKYTPEGGNLLIKAQLINDRADLPPQAPAALALPAFLIGVHDNGMGIDPEDQAQVFNRFFRTEQATRQQIQGSGLGLTIVKSFVELHGGNIWLNSEVEQGTSVYFTIPLVEGI